MFPPPLHQANPFAYNCSFTLHTSYMNGMLDEGGGGGEGCQKAEKQIVCQLIKSLIITNFV